MSSFLLFSKETFHLIPYLLSFLLSAIFLYKWLFISKPNKRLNLPPSPPKLPLIGHLHKLGTLPHRSLRSISNKYGEIILLYLGQKPTLVVSSSKYAQEIFKTHDLIFSNRPKLRYVNRIFYDGEDVGFKPYCSKWRHMKSICVLQLLSKKKVNSLRSIREEEVALLIKKIKGYNGSIINLSETLTNISSDLISRAALGGKYKIEDGSESNLHELINELMAVMGTVSVGDYIPMLGWIDKLRGLEGRAEYVRKKFDDFIEEIVQLHQSYVDEEGDGKSVGDFVDVLLQVQREYPEQLSRDNIKAIILDMFVAGTETSSTTLEWAMLELLRHPTSMRKLREDINNKIGSNNRVSEDDLESMDYLDAVIKETLRLHLPSPLLVFRECYEDVKINNYDINARTQVIINAWAIQRDPKIWPDPEKFFPERFLNTTSPLIDYKGQNFEFIPFGAGRRGCPGISYGIANTKLILASLVYEFNWTLPNGRDAINLDIKESSGHTTRPLCPLKVIAYPYVVSSCDK